MSAIPPKPDPANVQGVVYSGFAKFKSCHMIFRFTPGTSDVNGFISALLPRVQSAEYWGVEKPRNFVNIGFTFDGLKATEVPFVEFDIFPIEFRLGPTNYYSQQTLCDLGTNDPQNWAFGNQTAEKRVDCLVHCYGIDDEGLDEMIEQVSHAATTREIKEIVPIDSTTAAPIRYRSSPDLPPGIFHFFFRDGMSEPKMDWPTDWTKNSDAEAANNFVVGYPKSSFLPGPNFYDDPANLTGQFAKDGCYNAFRIFYQDVKGFEDFLAQHAPMVAQRLNSTEEHAKGWIAAKLNGRWRNGSPLVLSPDQEDPDTADASNFDYSADKAGLRCPVSSHTRVANPRDQKMFRTEHPIPKILRRGAPYGKIPVPPHYTGEQGLIGMFLCGSIGQQFEKIYGWINANNFSPVFVQSSQDGMIANRKAPHALRTFNIPMETGEPVVLDLAEYQFVVTRGTAYCFLPSLKALKMIADTRI